MTTTHLTPKEVSRGSVHLDTIRGVAALIVFANHTRALYFASPISSTVEANIGPAEYKFAYGDGIPKGEVKFANEAVIIFFVLSGYLVGGSVLRLLKKAQWSWKTYLTKRLTRLLVVLIPALVIGSFVDYVGLKFLGSSSVYTTSLHTPLGHTYNIASRLIPSVLVGNLFFTQTILVPHAGSNASLWSLTSEFWYYIAFPLGLLALYPGKRSATSRCVYGTAAIATLYFIGWRIIALFPLWILGAMIILLPQKVSINTARKVAAFISIALICSMFGVRMLHLNVIPAWYIIGTLTAFLIFFLAHDKQAAKNGIYKKLSSYFSHISYSLYLFHLPLATLLCGLIDNPWNPWSKSQNHIATWIGADICVLIVVTLLWHLFEAKTDAIREFIFKPANATPSDSIQMTKS